MLPDGRIVVTGGFGYLPNNPLAFFYSNKTFVLDPSLGDGAVWDDTVAGDFPWQRSAMGCASTSAGVLCAGGGSTEPAYRDAAIFDAETNEWTAVKPMQEARNYFGMATTTTTTTNTTTTTTSEATSMSKTATSTTTTSESVYAVGGFCCSSFPSYCFFSPLASVEKYDVAGGAWTEVTPLPDPHASLQAAAPFKGADSVVAIGGNSPGDVLIATSP